MNDRFLQYKIALSLVPGIGDVRAKSLVSYCGSVEGVFMERKALLKKIPGIGEHLADSIAGGKILQRAEEEMNFMEKEEARALFYLDEDYPVRLKHCEDAPVLLYYKGNADLNAVRVISVVGSRRATDYGKSVCERIISEIREQQALIVSGLAYGIDTCAHRSALKNGLSTAGVLAHGLDLLYPAENENLARRMLNHGALLTEFPSGTHMHPDYFPRRNRIIAGIADAVIVVEASMKSGSLITAEIANSYSRDVFAVPGRLDDTGSEGCNFLIKTNKAALLQAGKDIVYIMGWENRKKPSAQPELFYDLNAGEEALVEALRNKAQLSIDELCFSIKQSMSKVSSMLLNLEFAGLVKSLPGKMYRLNS